MNDPLAVPWGGSVPTRDQIDLSGERRPRYCPWCGSQVSKWGHDDSCTRPIDSIGLHVGEEDPLPAAYPWRLALHLFGLAPELGYFRLALLANAILKNPQPTIDVFVAIGVLRPKRWTRGAGKPIQTLYRGPRPPEPPHVHLWRWSHFFMTLTDNHTQAHVTAIVDCVCTESRRIEDCPFTKAVMGERYPGEVPE